MTTTAEPWPKRPWLTDSPTRALDLTVAALAAHLPRELAHLGDRLRGHGLAEAREAAARVDRDAAADRRVAVAQQLLGLAGRAQPDVLVPVELERGRQVVDLGEVEIVGPDAGFRVRAIGDRVLERAAVTDAAAPVPAAESVAKLGSSMTGLG